MRKEQPSPPGWRRPLVGRSDELACLEREVDRARSGLGTAMVLRGTAGSGKSALLDTAAGLANGMEIKRCRGVESEQAMAYAGLQLLCIGTDLGVLDRPQRVAMERAFGRADGDPDPYPIGLATFSLLTAVRRPTLYLIDDSQWLDDASAAALAFTLRRLGDHPAGFLLATRTLETDAFSEFPARILAGLSEAEAGHLFESASFGRVDPAVRGRIVAETDGNPAAVLDAVGNVLAPAFAAGYGVAPSSSAESSPDQLDTDQRRLLLLAAAEPTGDPAVLWPAAKALGIDDTVAGGLADRGHLRIGSRVLFRDPSGRAAAYRSATAEERSSIHRALANATDPISAADRRSWHLACATNGLDDRLAAELARCSVYAQRRSGRAGAAELLEKSALLTQDPRLRSERALAAAAARLDAGSPAGSAQLLATAELGLLDDHSRGGLHRQRARLAFFTGRNGQAAEQLLRAAQELQSTDERTSCEAFLEALVASTYAGHLGPGVDALANKVPTDWMMDGLSRRLLDGLTARFAHSFRAGHRTLLPPLRSAAGLDDEDNGRRWLWMASYLAADLWDDELWAQLAAKAVETANRSGSIGLLPYALASQSVSELLSGNFERARHLLGRIDAIAKATRAPRFSTAAVLLAGWRGEEDDALACFDTARREAQGRGEGRVLSAARLATAILYNGLGRYDEALEAARDAAARDDLAIFGWALVELIEAAARSGQSAAAKAGLTALTERTQTARTDWALGIEARSRALLTDGDEAEQLYQEALDRLSRTTVRVQLARARLVYGEWLRRQGRRVDARAQLTAARDSLTEIGALAFAERAHREYLATGEKLRRRGVGSGAELTPQEERITGLARSGLTNPEIGERLFLSPRTIEYHLHKVFEKLGITSRRELLQAVAEPEATG